GSVWTTATGWLAGEIAVPAVSDVGIVNFTWSGRCAVIGSSTGPSVTERSGLPRSAPTSVTVAPTSNVAGVIASIDGPIDGSTRLWMPRSPIVVGGAVV